MVGSNKEGRQLPAKEFSMSKGHGVHRVLAAEPRAASMQAPPKDLRAALSLPDSERNIPVIVLKKVDKYLLKIFL